MQDLFASFAFVCLFTENGTYFCSECDSKFAEEEVLKRHMHQVHSDKPYKCDRCQAAFRYKGNLASHKTVHTGKGKGGEKKSKTDLNRLSRVVYRSTPLTVLLALQERSRIDATSAVHSSIDQLTSRPTHASILEKSHTSVRRVGLASFRYFLLPPWFR